LSSSASAKSATAKSKSGFSPSSNIQTADKPAQATIHVQQTLAILAGCLGGDGYCRDKRCGDVAVCRSGLQKILA
jgi:hypothetical protein